MIARTVNISEDFEEHIIDGVRIAFQNTPGTEAPVEMNAWSPEQKVFWAAENISATVHNIYTLRGTLVRDAYANFNNQIMRLANQGFTINEIHNEYRVPASLQQQWNVRQYHGSEFHNSRTVTNRFLGY